MSINVFDENGNVIAQVEGNYNLDWWDGSNHTCGSTGRHKGLTRLKDGQYVLIHGTQWQGERDHAELITPNEALQEILRSGNEKLLDEDRFQDLEKLRQETMTGEME